jgi:F-type H+-transporting ATPase subunit b
MAAEAAKRQAALGEKLAEDVKAAEARIDEAKQAAVGNINQVATEVAQAATRRLIGLDVDAAAAAASVKAVLEGKG